MWSSQGRITPFLGHISVFYEVLNGLYKSQILFPHSTLFHSTEDCVTTDDFTAPTRIAFLLTTLEQSCFLFKKLAAAAHSRIVSGLLEMTPALLVVTQNSIFPPKANICGHNMLGNLTVNLLNFQMCREKESQEIKINF